jgi:hypothetical protein
VLELRENRTFTWRPNPGWGLSSGRWEIYRDDDGSLRLCFEKRAGGLRCEILVFMAIPDSDVPLFMNWLYVTKRTVGNPGSVVFEDRIWMATRPK